MKTFFMLSFTLLFFMASTVLADFSVYARMKKSANVDDINNMTPDVLKTLHLYLDVAEKELKEKNAKASSASDILDGNRQLRGSNNERRLPPCLNTCPKCMNNGNTYLYCQVYCGLCARRSLLDEILAFETTPSGDNPMKGKKCTKVPHNKSESDLEEVIKKEHFDGFAKNFSPDKADPTYFICEE